MVKTTRVAVAWQSPLDSILPSLDFIAAFLPLDIGLTGPMTYGGALTSSSTATDIVPLVYVLNIYVVETHTISLTRQRDGEKKNKTKK